MATRHYTARPLADRFWPKVDKSAGPDACWPWTASKVGGTGYGKIQETRGGKCLRAHRASWELAYGPIPDGLRVLHRCDNPACVNPAHLFLGTDADNVADMQAKGRRGIKPDTLRMRELTPIVRRLYFADGKRQTEIARLLGIGQSSVSRCVVAARQEECAAGS